MYTSDWKKVCKSKKSKKDKDDDDEPKEVVPEVKDKNFHGSSIQKEDFFIFRIKDFLHAEEKECKKKVKVKELVDIRCTGGTEQFSAENIDLPPAGFSGKMKKNKI